MGEPETSEISVRNYNTSVISKYYGFWWEIYSQQVIDMYYI